MRSRAMTLCGLGLLILSATGAVSLTGAATAGASLPQLTRYPYLTNVVSGGNRYQATVNWATDQSQGAGHLTFGRTGAEPSTAHAVTAVRTAITVNGVSEYQWRARIRGLLPGTKYSYRVFFDGPKRNLLGRGTSRTFTTPPAPGSSASFSFAVIGDWGWTNAAGLNPYQADLDAQVASSGASFILSAGDTAYQKGTQANYGDLFQTGPGISEVFGAAFYRRIGFHIPMFQVPGNHGFNQTLLDVWPEGRASALSGGRYRMDTYRVPGTKTSSYPSVWYAFTVGKARFYLLTAAWPNGNIGSGSLYSDDHAAHWKPTSAQYQWLANDLATHPAQLKVAVCHFPMYSDVPTEGSDPYLHGPGSLGALLTQHGVQLVFNGHAHVYERNHKQPGESFVSYVTGGGGGRLQGLGPSTSIFDAYGIGWNYGTNRGTATGSAPVPTSPAQVFSFLLVKVNGTRVIVQPTDSQGRMFDVMTYQF